ncbi:MAG: recombination protein RecR [Opitutales bacterium]|nr:recombination protein RecR [Opitutales bacterium]MCH8540231.1 recombination mediator RecR [Opitutales bacterium]
MSPAFDELVQRLKALPGLGIRSAERIALHLLVQKPEDVLPLQEAITKAAEKLHRCPICGNLAEGDCCSICADSNRDPHLLCVVENVPDLLAIERSSAYRGRYHVLHGKLSPLHDVGPEELNLGNFTARLEEEKIREIILAVSNDIEGEATCHYLTENLIPREVTVSRIGFGLPSGAGVVFADATTLKSALEARRPMS